MKKILKTLKLKWTEYLLEIIVIVIGILVAFMLNNWNENRNKEKLVTEILLEVQNDLVVNIERADEVLLFYKRKDSLISYALSDTIDITAMYKPQTLPVIYKSFAILDNGFNRLMQNGDHTSEKYKSIMADLKELFVANKNLVEKYNEEMKQVAFDHLNDMKNQTSWYYKFYYTNEYASDSEAQAYLLSDIYKNRLTHYWNIGIADHYTQVQIFRINSARAYNEIVNLLGTKANSGSVNPNFPIDTDDYKDWLGVYHATNSTNKSVSFEIVIENNTLFSIVNNERKSEIFPISKAFFLVANRDEFNSIRIDKNGNVNGINTRYKMTDFEWTKEK